MSAVFPFSDSMIVMFRCVGVRPCTLPVLFVVDLICSVVKDRLNNLCREAVPQKSINEGIEMKTPIG